MIFNRVVMLSLVIAVVVAVVSASEDECTCDAKLSLKTKAAVKAATAGLAGALGTSALGSSVVGFTLAGIAKGSLAAYIQAKLGIFGAFSALQSLGATGGFLLGGPIGLGVAAVVGTATYFIATSGTDKTVSKKCSCDSEEPSTEDELTQLFALKAIESCVEPGTSISRKCSRRGICELNKDDEELYCVCKAGFAGTYCEILQKGNSNTKESFSRCADEFIEKCTQCLIRKFTLDTPQKNCYQLCNWKNRKSVVALNGDNRPDVGSLEMKRVLKMSVIEGTECSVLVNATCTTNIKYVYEHSDDYLDQLVVYYSSDEANCK